MYVRVYLRSIFVVKHLCVQECASYLSFNWNSAPFLGNSSKTPSMERPKWIYLPTHIHMHISLIAFHHVVHHTVIAFNTRGLFNYSPISGCIRSPYEIAFVISFKLWLTDEVLLVASQRTVHTNTCVFMEIWRKFVNFFWKSVYQL